uniref:HEPN_MAE_28990 domain-containing protein n=1 Tax=Ascaris lumbricoides TaxID=6252 RepID=A0A0M3HH48_ASCLU
MQSVRLKLEEAIGWYRKKDSADKSIIRVTYHKIALNFSDIFGALSKLNALRLEHCDSSIAEAYSNRVVIAILNVFKNFSDENSFWEQISWALSMVSELSESVTERLFEALELGRLKYGFSAVNARTKRQSYHKTTKSTKIISEEQASQLMFPFDTLIAANKDVVAMYLQNIIDVISSFCMQVDSSRIMKAAGLTLS